jgi:hypothetical protein
MTSTAAPNLAGMWLGVSELAAASEGADTLPLPLHLQSVREEEEGNDRAAGTGGSRRTPQTFRSSHLRPPRTLGPCLAAATAREGGYPAATRYDRPQHLQVRRIPVLHRRPPARPRGADPPGAPGSAALTNLRPRHG